MEVIVWLGGGVWSWGCDHELRVMKVPREPSEKYAAFAHARGEAGRGGARSLVSGTSCAPPPPSDV